MRRSGLDYHELAELVVHDSWAALRAALPGGTWYAFTTKATHLYAETRFQAGDVSSVLG